MSDKEFEIKPIRLAFKEGAGLAPSPPGDMSLGAAFAPLAAALREALRPEPGRRATGTGDLALVGAIEDFLKIAESLDRQYGDDAELPVPDVGTALDQTLGSLAELDRGLDTHDLADRRDALSSIVIGIGYWAMRHRLAIGAAAPIVNALAGRANGAATRQEAAAIYALMQGFIDHFKPQLGADLERSNPERPWRLLNLNFAITAIRTGDPAMMKFAFATLESHLPDESDGFYAEALALARQPGFPAETCALIEAAKLANSAGWTRLH